MLQVFHELWDFVSLFQKSSLSTFHQVMRVHVRTFVRKSESFTWLHNHSSGQRAVYGRGWGHPTDIFLVNSFYDFYDKVQDEWKDNQVFPAFEYSEYQTLYLGSISPSVAVKMSILKVVILFHFVQEYFCSYLILFLELCKGRKRVILLISFTENSYNS